MSQEELLERYREKAGKFQEKKFTGIIILSIWILALSFGFAIWLKGWCIGTDLVYQPRGTISVLNTLELTKFLFTVSLFTIAGNIAQNVYNLFRKFWEIEALGDRLEFADSEDEKEDIIIRIKYLLNSSSTNITFLRPLFFPVVSGILAIPVIFLVYGLNTDLPRVAVVSFLTGIVANVALEQLHSKAKGFIEALFGTT